MAFIRTEEEAKKDLAALDAMCEELKNSHGLREYWAAAVHYGELTVDEAVKAQEASDKQFEKLTEDISYEPKVLVI